MPDKRPFSQSVGSAVIPFLRSLVFAGLVAASAALLTAGCTDEGGNGHFVAPGSDAAAGAGGAGGGTGGDSAGGAGGDSAGGAGGDSAGGTSGGGTGGGTGGTNDDAATD